MHRFVENGYEITAGENEIIFVDRRTWGIALLMVVLGILAAILIVLSGLSVSGMAELRSDVSGVALPAAAAVLLVVIWLGGRAYRARRDTPTEDVRDILIVDRPSEALRGRMGEILAQFDDVKARMHIDWWTRGAMRIVVLTWPGGRRTIYRSFGRRRSLDLLVFLKEQGLDAE